ncbi:hypothetical protein FHG87_024630, partial [Trinorchestia longiramus]
MRERGLEEVVTSLMRTQGTLPNFVFTDDENLTFTRSPDLNPLDFSIWSILETRVLATPHTSLKFLKAKLQKEWEAILQEQIRAACDPPPPNGGTHGSAPTPFPPFPHCGKLSSFLYREILHLESRVSGRQRVRRTTILTL